MRDAGSDGRALKTLEVGLAAPSAAGGMGWGNGYCCCKRKLPAASTTAGDRNTGIRLQEVRNQWFAFTLPQQHPALVLSGLSKETASVAPEATAHVALEHGTDPGVRGFLTTRGTVGAKANLHL